MWTRLRFILAICLIETQVIRAQLASGAASYPGPAPQPYPAPVGPTYPRPVPQPAPYPGPAPVPAPAPVPSYQPGLPVTNYGTGRPAQVGYGPAPSPGPVGPSYAGTGQPSYPGGPAPAPSYGAPSGPYSPGSGSGYGAPSGGYGPGPVGPSHGGGCCGSGGTGGYGGYGSGTGGCGPCGDNSDPCFRKYSDCIIVNAQPYERRSQVSLDDCKSYCRNTTAGQYQCRSFVYDNINRICDLFAHAGNQPPAKLVKYTGRDYYEPTGLTNCTSGGTPGPSGAPCGPGQASRYIQVPGYQYTGAGSGVQSPATSVQACIDACTKGQTADGKSISCKSFDFNNGQCTFYSSTPPAAGQAAGLTASANSVHVDQICVDSGQNCAGPSERVPQFILVGFAEMVTDAKDFNDCMQKCINAQTTANVNCKSGMFYYQESSNNCILNTETKASHPDLFNKETSDVVDYFEPNCAGAALVTLNTGGGRRLAQVQRFLNKKFPAASSEDSANTFHSDDETFSSAGALGEWTHWSPCDRRKDGRRIRYRVCTKPLKQCPFESEWCNLSSDGASRRTVQGSSPLFGFVDFSLRNPTETDPSSDINCAADVCCPIFGGCRIGLQRSSTTGQVHWCTNPCQDTSKTIE